jgi:peptide/nickel transport system substrate-binding protein
VPRKYVEKVGEDAFKKAPVGAGPYKFVSFTPGVYVYGSYPDIDALFKDQAVELDRKKREALLHRIQQLMHEKAMHIPVWELAFINGHGPRVQESGLGLIPGHAYSAPYEDVTLEGK